MLIPLGTDRPNRRPTLVTYALIVLNAGIYTALSVIQHTDPALAARLRDPLVLNPADWHWWQFVSYQFLHGSLMHLLGNMAFLLVFGPGVEDRLRRMGFLLFYLVGGVFAGLCHMILGSEVVQGAGGAHSIIPAHPVVGASGSISCVTGAFLVFFPLTNIRVFLWFIYIGQAMIPSWLLITVSIIKDLFMEGFGGNQGVAHLAHLGGYLYGGVIGLLLLWTKVLPRETYDLLSIGRQAQRRRRFKELTTSGEATPWLIEQATAKKRPERKQEVHDVRTPAQGEVASLLAANDLDGAAAKYAEVVLIDPGVSFAREAHLVLANHCYATGRLKESAAAYSTFLARWPEDREAHRVRLMLALLSARYLGDPARARELLAVIKPERLVADEREVAEQLRAELV